MRGRVGPGAAWLAALVVAATASPAGAAAPAADLGPPRLRVCCAFGQRLSLAVNGLGFPVQVDNVVDAGALGRHTYAARSVFDERNGLLYTCRGGFVDTAHVRGTADLAAWIYARGAALLGSGAALELAGEDGRFRLSFPAARLEAADHDAAMREIAARVAWSLSLWHELVTWAGGRTVAEFSEGFSAFSPEDLYSDLLGAQLARRALADPRPWDQAMDAALAGALAQLEARPAADTRRALEAVAGRWWDPSVPIPRQELLLARSFDAGPEVAPWRLAEPGAAGCAPLAAALALSAPSLDAPRAAGATLGTLYGLELLDPPPHLAAAAADGVVREAQLGTLVRAAAEEARTRGERGRGAASAPERSPEAPEAPGGAVQLLPFEVGGGASLGGEAGGPAGLAVFEVRGGHADTLGGQLAAVRFSSAWLPGRSALATRFVGLEARALFSCRDREAGVLRAPVAAWFQDCDAGGAPGVEGMLAAVQLDGGVGRMVVRPIELALALDAGRTAFTPAFLRRRLVLFAGASVDAHSRPGGPQGVAAHAHGGARFALATGALGLRVEGYGSWRQGLGDPHDHALETGLRATHRLPLGRDAATGLPAATLSWTLESGWSWWTRPATSMASFVLPVISDVEPHTLHVVATLGLAFERLGL